jgi:glycosyltransferase involved in cell wall biosynthesis/tetratricopeptide (TPR) repeat protein
MKLAPYLLNSRERREAAKVARKNGDRARERQQWREAAKQYQDYLTVFPAHFSLWVQLGHMHKEAGSFDLADHAYGKARALKPGDGDLLLNMGHLRKREGRLKEAAAFYLQCVRLTSDPSAIQELGSGLLSALTESKAMADLYESDPDTEKAIAPLFDGASLVRAYCIVKSGGSDRLQMSGHDPQMHFTLDASLAAAPVTMVEVAFERGPKFDATAGTLFIDYGQGFRVKDCFSLRYPDAKTCIFRVFLAAPNSIKALRWDPVEGTDAEMSLKYVRAVAITFTDDLVDRVFDGVNQQASENAIAHDPLSVTRSQLRDNLAPFFAKPTLSDADQRIMQPFLPPWETRTHAYSHWRHLYANPGPADFGRMADMIDAMAWRPRFSFVMPVYNTPKDLLIEVMDSMLGQNYPDFEICVADDCSPDGDVQDILEAYAAKDPRVKYVRRAINGHISLASNSAARLATGDYIVLIDHDDLIPPYTLLVVAAYLNRYPDARIIFSDEDKISPTGEHFDPYFKSCYNEYLMYGHNMISHLGVYQRTLFESVGGFRRGMEGSQDYDFALRCADRIDPSQIIHIPHILYHWRQVPGSTSVSSDAKDYAVYAARTAINGHFERLGLPLRSVEGHAPGNNAIAAARELETSISIIIPTRNGEDLLDDCLRSIAKHSPGNIEILIVDNDSDEPAAIAYLQSVGTRYPDLNVRVLPAPGPFNFSAINNLAAAQASGEILCFLNNDTEVRTPGWLDRARGLLSMTDVGVVGGRLLYPDQTIQHFGIVTGMYDHAVAGGVHLFEHGNGHGYFSKHRMIGEFSAVTAACMFVRRRDFEAVGGFETDLAVAYNDIDLSLKLRGMGRRVLCDPEILMIHKESKSRGDDSSPEKAARLDREARWMQERWGAELTEDRYYSPNLSRSRPDFSLSYPPRQPWPWETDCAARPSIARGVHVRAPRFFREGQMPDRGTLAVCALLEDEPADLLEWIAYHRVIGVEKFYLYDRMEDGRSRHLLQDLMAGAIVDLVPWPRLFTRKAAYDDFADRNGQGWTWAAFVDPKTYINPVGYSGIPAWLEGLKGASAVHLQEWEFAEHAGDGTETRLLIEAGKPGSGTPRPQSASGVRLVRMKDYDASDALYGFTVHGTVVDAEGATWVGSGGSRAAATVAPSVCIHQYVRHAGEAATGDASPDAGHIHDGQVGVASPAVHGQSMPMLDDDVSRFTAATRIMLEQIRARGTSFPRSRETDHG